MQLPRLNLNMGEKMLDRDTAIAAAKDAAEAEYLENGDELSIVQFVDASFEDRSWIVEFKIWGWLESVWRVWEYKGEVYCDLIGG